MKVIRPIKFVFIIFLISFLHCEEIDLSHSIKNPNGWRLPKDKYLKLLSSDIRSIAGIPIIEEKYEYTGGYSFYVINNRIVNGNVDLKEWEREWPHSINVFKRNEDNKILLYQISSTPEELPLHEGLMQEQENLEVGIEGGMIGTLVTSFYLDLDDDGKYETSFPSLLSSDEKEKEQYIEDLIKLKINSEIKKRPPGAGLRGQL